MPKFNITINPALRTVEGSTQIVVTSILKRAKVECALDDLPAEMIKAATGVVSREHDAPLLNVYASVDGRSFKAFKEFVAADKNTMLIFPVEDFPRDPDGTTQAICASILDGAKVGRAFEDQPAG